MVQEELDYKADVFKRMNTRQDKKSLTYEPSFKSCKLCEIKYGVYTNIATLECILYNNSNIDESHYYLCNACILQELKLNKIKFITNVLNYHAKYVLPHIMATLSRKKSFNSYQLGEYNSGSMSSTDQNVIPYNDSKGYNKGGKCNYLFSPPGIYSKGYGKKM